jgi:pyruvate dehydrogenase E2 component (dihydrolipoyllysine-residue acetyltransferase)
MPTNVIMPQMGESIAEGTVTKWLKKVGERVERDEPLLEISTDKVDAEIPSPASGVLIKIMVKENETVEVNAVLALIDGEGAAVETPAPERPSEAKAKPPTSAAPAAMPQTPPAPSAPPRGEGEKIRSSPLVRRIAREHDIDLSQVKGTGLGGRISKKDILDFIAQAGATAPAAAAPAKTITPPAAPPPAAPEIVFSGPTHVVPMTAMRRQIAENMAASKKTSAHVTTVFEVEMTRITGLMEKYADEFERRNGLKLTYTPFFIRASVGALKTFPVVNSSMEGTNIVYKRDINIGVAVALETGLIVPVIKHADEMNFLGTARAVREFADRARSKRLSVDDVHGGTFTITNPGVFGSLFGTPIILQPQVAILGVGTVEKRPVVRDDAIAIRSMVYLALSFDHRVIDGATGDQFMARLKAILENWDESLF